MGDLDSFSHIQSLLIKEGFVTSEDIKKARQIRMYNKKLASLPIGLILVKENCLSNKAMNSLLDSSEIQKNIKTYLNKKGWVDKQSVDDYLMKQEKGVTLAGLVQEGLLTENQLNEAVHEQLGNLTFGKHAVLTNKVSAEDLGKALQIKKYNKSVSEILYDIKLVTLTELNHVFRKIDKGLKIGTILIQQDLINEEKLGDALSEQRGSSLSLGKILIQKKYITLAQLYFALSIQYNTPFQKLKGFVFNEKQEIELRNVVGQRYAEENRILPLFLNESNLTLGVSSPSNIMRMHEIMPVHPQLKMNCVLITEEKFEQLYAILYGEIINNNLLVQSSEIEEIPPDRKFVLTDPGSQPWLINTLFDRYKKLGGVLENSQKEKSDQLFSEFIIESYHYISTEFTCTSVSFWFEIKNESIGIMAAPNM